MAVAPACSLLTTRAAPADERADPVCTRAHVMQTPTHMDSLDPDPVIRPVRSEQDLADMNSLGMFTRRSSFADVPYLALPGINSRVSYSATSQHSLHSDLESSLFLQQADVTLMPSFTPALLRATFTALLSALQFG